MSDSDEKRLEDDEVVAAEQSDDGPDVEGHKWHMGEADKAAHDAERAARPY